ncbi:T9SS type A sorting domain-containing protein [bacterium]|nr:MAG: T9SS type A sorting domain-containing protein [bacterium]
MYNTNTKVQGVNKITTLAIAALLFIAGFSSTYAQYPSLPVLSLTGQDGGYNDVWFPNGRILMPRNTNFAREFVVPVFIDNRWAQHPGKYTVDLPIEPIKSFQFKLFYDSATVRPVGVETSHPKFIPRNATFEDPLAKDFHINWDDIVDKSYYRHIEAGNNATANRGHAVVITGSSSKPLPNTALDFQEFKVLLYVRFRAVLKQDAGQEEKNLSYLHIGRDTIIYNDMNILQEAPFVSYRTYDTQIPVDFPDPQRPTFESNPGAVFTGLAGIDNSHDVLRVNKILPGGIWFQYMTAQPEFGFEIHRNIGSQPPIQKVNNRDDLFELVDPMTVDLNPNRNPNPFPNIATRSIEVEDIVAGTMLKNIEVSSDQPWLQFKTTSLHNEIPSYTRNGFIDYIDNGILGEAAQRDEKYNIPNDKGPITLEIACDPSKIQAGDDAQDDPEIEKTGIYTGYITFKSEFANISPIRIKVTFIYFRPPLEGQQPNGTGLTGIPITISNRDGEVDTLIFGTGDRATIGVDTLFGETAYNIPLSNTELDARFFPLDANGNEIPGLAPFGMSDFATNDEFVKANSRDIRSSDDTTRSLLFKVKFNPGPDNKDQRFPIVVTWNRNDFIQGSSLFIRDANNGQSFAPVNLWKEGTALSNGRYSFNINDPRIREFIIEYTPAKIVKYVDSEGNPIINPGWNLLSLPVMPFATGPGQVWAHALNDKPYYFFLNSYLQEENVRAGVGYFVKYGPDTNDIDKVFRGSSIYEVSPDINPVRVYIAEKDKGGWNAVGAPSVPINIEALDFREYNNNPRPDKNYMLQHGVWKYVTKRGYQEVSELRPGLGYWIKVNETGYYFFNTANPKLAQSTPPMLISRNEVKNMATEIVISDNNQSSNELYVSNKNDLNLANFELPPLPPSFDVRFEGNTELTNKDNAIIQLTNVEYPISISAKGMNGTFELYDAATNEYFGTISSDDMSSVEINSSSNAIRLSKVETETVSSNSVYPNPVVSNATINFNLPNSGNVDVTLVDAVGNTVSNIFSGNKDAGDNSVEFNANGFASGNYFVKVVAGTYNKVLRLQVVK